MSKKIIALAVLLVAVFLGGCVSSQIRHADGRVENRLEVLGTSMNIQGGFNRGYPPIGYGGVYGGYGNYPDGGMYRAKPGSGQTYMDCSSGICNPRFAPVY